MCLGNNSTEKYLCVFSTDAIFNPEKLLVTSDGESADKEDSEPAGSL